MAHMLTIKDLETRTDGTYYVGPLDEAQAFIRSYANVSVVSMGGRWEVWIDNSGRDAIPSAENCDEFGKGPTEEIAWRYALGAAFGPADEEFSAFPLTRNNAEAVRALVDHHFPAGQRIDVFYSTTTAHAIVMDNTGILWQVYPDGGLKTYRD